MTDSLCSLTGNDVEEEGLQALIDALRQNRTLRELQSVNASQIVVRLLFCVRLSTGLMPRMSRCLQSTAFWNEIRVSLHGGSASVLTRHTAEQNAEQYRREEIIDRAIVATELDAVYQLTSMEKAGIKVDSLADQGGRRIVHVAVAARSYRVLDWVLSQRDGPAQFRIKDGQGRDPAQLAEAAGRIDVLAWLMSRGIDLSGGVPASASTNKADTPVTAVLARANDVMAATAALANLAPQPEMMDRRMAALETVCLRRECGAGGRQSGS
jgi:hypothetical protein